MGYEVHRLRGTRCAGSGRCPRCGEYGTLVQVATPTSDAVPPGRKASTAARAPRHPARSVAGITAEGRFRASAPASASSVIGPGRRPGGRSSPAVQRTPGSGKSTLILAVADALARQGRTVLYLSGEESVQQLAVRARRIGAEAPTLLLADDTDLAAVMGHLDAHAGDLILVIIDSIQTIASAEVEDDASRVTQVMEVTQALTRVAKARGLPMVLIGQVTKDSNVAGPRALEHVVDTTLSLDGDRHSSLRLLRTVKNRFGALEVAAFEQTDSGMAEVLDPSLLFTGDRDAPVPGTCLTVTVEGNRPLLAEVQALLSKQGVGQVGPTRCHRPLDTARAAMLVAVTERSGDFTVANHDVFLATLGGMRLIDPAADLAVCLALASARTGVPVPLEVAAIGEVALAGDVRGVPTCRNVSPRRSDSAIDGCSCRLGRGPESTAGRRAANCWRSRRYGRPRLRSASANPNIRAAARYWVNENIVDVPVTSPLVPVTAYVPGWDFCCGVGQPVWVTVPGHTACTANAWPAGMVST